MEGISPELVLVDPELAARVRGHGPVSDCLAPRPRTAPPGPKHEHRLGARIRTTVLLLSLAVNAVLLGAAWSDGVRPSSPPTVPASIRVGTVPGIGDAATSGGVQQPPCSAHPEVQRIQPGTGAPACG